MTEKKKVNKNVSVHTWNYSMKGMVNNKNIGSSDGKDMFKMRGLYISLKKGRYME